MSNCILLAGKARCGKNTFAEYMIKRYPSFAFKQGALADKIRDIAGIVYMIPKDIMYNDFKKDVPYLTKNGRAISPREALQHTGDKFKVMISQDIWSDLLYYEQLANFDNVVITDHRFPAERLYFESKFNNTITIKIIRNGCDIHVMNKNHQSEMQTIVSDHEIENNGTFEDYYKKIDTLMNKILYENLEVA